MSIKETLAKALANANLPTPAWGDTNAEFEAWAYSDEDEPDQYEYPDPIELEMEPVDKLISILVEHNLFPTEDQLEALPTWQRSSLMGIYEESMRDLGYEAYQ